jgi:RNA polymerase I-specific transcription initiation factor RRN6
LPEAGPASATLKTIAKTMSPAGFGPYRSALLAIGKAADLDHTSGTRTIDIMAMVYGEAGNILRLIKPRTEGLKWDSFDDTKLRLLNPTSSEDCYWSADGGAIQQITFAADTDGLTSWLAVLKEESTTILRPIYRRDLTPSTMSASIRRRFPPSHLGPNPVLRLGNERTGTRPHVDVSFNPWYVRQFAIIDQQGYWSVWDIEGQKRKRTTFEAKPGRSGHIRDDSLQDQSFKSHHSADGWGRVLWAGGFNTLVLCDRRNLAVFDLKAMPKRLYSPQIVHPKSTDWILDVKRSTSDLHHVFVLTTSRVFWLQITEAGEDKDEQYGYRGAKILLSCQHFRDQENEAAKLELFREKEGKPAFLIW